MNQPEPAGTSPCQEHQQETSLLKSFVKIGEDFPAPFPSLPGVPGTVVRPKSTIVTLIAMENEHL
jgi:hypothetical protein